MATITTKFNVGDTAFTVDKQTMKIREFKIDRVFAHVYKDEVSISYHGEGDSPIKESYDEDKCFATKHELLTYIEQPAQSDE